ncbi:unnamed protein product [Calypogeia fissa]
MGNVTQCMAGKLHARVMQPDGKMVDYDYGIQVTMLMMLFPGYLVIHCSTDPVPTGGKGQFKVMEIVERLRLGQAYMMYPIRPKYKDIFKPPPVQMDRISGLSYLSLRLTLQRFTKKTKKVKLTKTSTNTNMRSRFWSRLWRLKLIARSFLSLFACRASSSVQEPAKVKSGGQWVQLLDLDSGNNPSPNSASDYSKTEMNRPGITEYPPQVRKPYLDDIPEYDTYGFFEFLPKSAYGQVPKKSPTFDRLQSPKAGQFLERRIGKVGATMLSRVTSSDDFSLDFSYGGYGELPNKSPTTDRLQSPKTGQSDLELSIGKSLVTSMSSAVAASADDFSSDFSYGGYGELPKKLPSMDRLQSPKTGECLERRIGKVATTMSSTVVVRSDDFSWDFSYGGDGELFKKSPTFDRLQSPKIGQSLEGRIGKVSTAMSSKVASSDFNFSSDFSYGEFPEKLPTFDRLQSPKTGQSMEQNTDKVATTMSSTVVASTEFSGGFRKFQTWDLPWDLRTSVQVTHADKSCQVFAGFPTETLITVPAVG